MITAPAGTPFVHTTVSLPGVVAPVQPEGSAACAVPAHTTGDSATAPTVTNRATTAAAPTDLRTRDIHALP
ncbi:hypothetical protein GCM10020229_00280 [Kitasatospora albolonga]